MTDTAAALSLLAAYADAMGTAEQQEQVDAREHAEQVKRDKLSLAGTLGDMLMGLGLNHPGLWRAAESYLDDTIIWSLIEEHGSQVPHVEIMWSVDQMREPPPVIAEEKDGRGNVFHTQYGPPRGPIVVVEPPEMHHCGHPQSSQGRLNDLLAECTTPEERIARLALYARQCPCGHWRKPR